MCSLGLLGRHKGVLWAVDSVFPESPRTLWLLVQLPVGGVSSGAPNRCISYSSFEDISLTLVFHISNSVSDYDFNII